MCITVTHVPNSRQNSIVVESEKILTHRYGVFSTPFISRHINGLLIAGSQLDSRWCPIVDLDNLNYGDNIAAGLIHSFVRGSKTAPSTIRKILDNNRIYESYSIGVKCYGEFDAGVSDAIGSLAIYVPASDERSIVKRRNKIAALKSRDKSEILKYFPELEIIESDIWGK